ncbi:MAG TPA: co-chaperone GroES [Kineosporiaceae bacterium]|nr:co-chaperone GroES [Kineosporiaceae bacterium]
MTQTANGAQATPGADRLPIRMLHDRVLVSVDGDAGERRSTSGIVIPATAAVGRRLTWATVVAVGQHVRQVQVGDRVLHDPEDRAEVEIHGAPYVLLRERDIHAVAAPRVEDGQTGLYL